MTTPKPDDQLTDPKKTDAENEQANQKRAEKIEELLGDGWPTANEDGDFIHEGDDE